MGLGDCFRSDVGDRNGLCKQGAEFLFGHGEIEKAVGHPGSYQQQMRV